MHPWIQETYNAGKDTFPHPAEMHSDIRVGIGPLLYSILRREFLQPCDVGVCANTQCRKLFEVERLDSDTAMKTALAASADEIIGKSTARKFEKKDYAQ